MIVVAVVVIVACGLQYLLRPFQTLYSVYEVGTSNSSFDID